MNKKYLFILVAAMVLLCVSSANAEYFSASLPADEYISDACSLDGSHLAVQEETLYTSELNELVDRLVEQNISVDSFISECNRFVSMTYLENDE